MRAKAARWKPIAAMLDRWQERRAARAFAAQTGSLYGLAHDSAGWPFRSEWDPDSGATLGVGYRSSLRDDCEELRVIVDMEPDEPLETFRAELARGLTVRAEADSLRGLDRSALVSYLDAQRAEPRPEPPSDAEWSSVSISVDGGPAAFDLVRSGERWAAVADRGDHRIVLAGTRYPIERVSLATVDDIRPFLRGSKRLSRALSGLSP